jgi:hypothetical protein
MKLLEILQNKNQPDDHEPTIVEQLAQYKSDPNVYIRFSNALEFGYSHQPKDDTPTGIYAYPLRQIWKQYNLDGKQNIDDLPYAKKRLYLHVFKYHHPIMQTKAYNNIEHDIETLKSRYSHLVNIDGELQKMQHKPPFTILWEITKHIAQELHPDQYANQWAKILKALNYSGFQDNSGIVHSGDAMQMFLLKPDDATVLLSVLNKSYKHVKTERLELHTIKDLVHALNNPEYKARNILSSIDGHLHQQLQQYLEYKNKNDVLDEFLEHRSASDIKVLLLSWLNGVVDFRSVDPMLLQVCEPLLNDSTDNIIKYTKSIAGFPWNVDVLTHNLELLRTK